MLRVDELGFFRRCFLMLDVIKYLTCVMYNNVAFVFALGLYG